MRVVSCWLYDDGRIESINLERWEPADNRSGFLWIDLVDPDEGDLESLKVKFNLHALAVEDAMSLSQVPKVDPYDGQIFVSVKSAALQGDEIVYGELTAFVSKRHIITVRHTPEEPYDHQRGKLDRGPEMSRHGPDFILHSMIDDVVDRYLPVLQMIEDLVLEMEQLMLEAFLEREHITRIFRLRREALHFQRVLARMSEVCGKLANLNIPCISADAKPYFRDVGDHLQRLDVMASSLIDVIKSVFEASNLFEQQRQGTIARQLAAWAAILAVPTAIAGIYGMNFKYMPEVNQPYGYPVTLVVMAIISGGLYIRFKQARWL